MKTLVLFFFLLADPLHAEEIYLLPTRIGDRTFNDLLIIETSGGSLTVPGVFSAPIFNVKVRMSWGQFKYNFSIKASEGGQETLVHYEVSIPTDSTYKISGTLKLQDGTVLGTIENGVRLREIR